MANIENMPDANRKCVGCGAGISPDSSPELCPKCLAKLSMETQPGTRPQNTVRLAGLDAEIGGMPRLGDQFGHYSVIRELGAGGMGAVYEARDLENGRRVAIKVLGHRIDSPEARQRFFREGRLAASINNPHTVYIFGTEEIEGTPVISMELVAGGTLQDLVHTGGPLPIGKAVDFVLQMIEGLEAARRIGILHRDIKPSNCFVDQDGELKVGDFGLSISTNSRAEPALTATGVFLGTPAFCSPEQLRGDELDFRSDMYSVGATLYYLLTGKTPFESKSMVQLLATVIEQRAPSPRTLRPEIPGGLAKAVLHCLAKLPGERFGSYNDLAGALAPYSSAAPAPGTLGLRFVAMVVDLIVLSTASWVAAMVFAGTRAVMMNLVENTSKVRFWNFGICLLSILYFAVFEGFWGAAAGKAICRLRVTGPNRGEPGFGRAALRSAIYCLLPCLPIFASYFTDSGTHLNASPVATTFVGLSGYLILGLMFATARRSNGFAAVQDLLSGTRVVSRGDFALRGAQPTDESAAPPDTGPSATIGPYTLMRPLPDSGGAKWWLGYDLKLLRKVWIRMVPAGTEPVPEWMHNLGRAGRLRWLTGQRSPEANWDAFEYTAGKSFLELISKPQPWGEVRYWLYDLAVEIGAARKDGTVPELDLDRVWITGEGRAKLLDFPAPGSAAPDKSGSVKAVPPSTPPASANDLAFLSAVAVAALSGSAESTGKPPGDVAVPLPAHARDFLVRASTISNTNDFAAALRPLLERFAAVTRRRRAAPIVLRLVICLLASGYALSLYFGFVREVVKMNPALMNLDHVLELRKARKPGMAQSPDDRQISIYIARHFRDLITNQPVWTGPLETNIIHGEARIFAERSVAEHPAPTDREIMDADDAVEKSLHERMAFEKDDPGWEFVKTFSILLLFTSIMSTFADLISRGGLGVRILGSAFVLKNGKPASRLRLLWRGVVAWSPLLLFFLLKPALKTEQSHWAGLLCLALFGVATAVSLALPVRGLEDRIAGTWPVPR